MQAAALFIFLITMVGWLTYLTWKLFGISRHYQRLVSYTGKVNLAESLEQILTSLNLEKRNLEELSRKIKLTNEEILHHVQKVGIVRFNPFSDTGGNQSFVLAILDGTDSGVVLTSLHNRKITRWYAKNVQNGKGVDHSLSEEEKKAIQKASYLKN